MGKIKILVVEDEMIIADNICDTLTDLGYVVLGPAINYTEAIAIMEKETPDIAMLDIQLSGRKTGIDIAKKIKETYNFPFIFLTSNTDFATVNEAKKTLPPAYLIKPFTKEELYTSIEIVLYNYSVKVGEAKTNEIVINNAFFIKEKGVYHKIIFEEIAYLKADHVYLEIKLITGKTYVVRTSLNDIIMKLSSKFIRIHRSYIVNSDFLQQIEVSSLLVNNEKLPIGKKYKEEILEKLSIV